MSLMPLYVAESPRSSFDSLAGRIYRQLSRGEPENQPPPDFDAWLREVSPLWTWDWPHLAYIRDALARLTSGENRRLMLFLPPRHGKSEMSTIRYPVWRLEREPATRICIGCYNQRFAERFGRRSRRIAAARGLLSPDRRASMEWESHEGGVYRSCGVGGTPMGEGFDLIIIDDPVKSRQEAESDSYRTAAWEWYQDLYTRLEPGASVLVIMTRWHDDDIAGRLLKEEADGGEAWEVVNLPALAEEEDPLGREEGEALCPERYPVPELEKRKRILGAYRFDAEFQQHPSLREGNLFKVGMLQIVDAVPAGLRSVRAWDLGATQDDGDYTAGVKMATDSSDRFFVTNVRRGQWEPRLRNAEMKQAAKMDGLTTRVRLAQDPAQAGKDQVQSLTAMFAGYRVCSERVTGDKALRADAFAAQLNAGNVYLLAGDWNEAFIEELRRFPGGKYDDQVDAASDAFNELTLGPHPGIPIAGGKRGAVQAYGQVQRYVGHPRGGPIAG